jgi:hypothetical protein
LIAFQLSHQLRGLSLVKEFHPIDQEVVVVAKRNSWPPFLPTRRAVAGIQHGADQPDHHPLLLRHIKTSYIPRMNLNAFARHDVFERPGIAGLLAARLRNPEGVRKARVFPYQLMSVDSSVPTVVREALQNAMETAILACVTGVGGGGTTPFRLLPGEELR